MLLIDIYMQGSPVMYLQESYTDSTGSYVIYAPMDSYALSLVLNGGNPDKVAILPSGFAILPDRPTWGSGKESSGSLLTVGFHIVDGASSEDSIPPESLDTMHHILMETAISIRTAVTPKY
jgi:homeobox-leucine zipper protein